MALVLPLTLAAACDDDGTGPDRLTAEEVSGVYTICTLVFTPENPSLSAVDIRAAAMAADPTPIIRVDTDDRFEFEYAPAGQIIPERPEGSVSRGAEAITLDFDSDSDPLAEAILLPEQLELDFAASPKSLSIAPPDSGNVETYDVDTETYAALSEESTSGLANQIPGSLTAMLRVGSCQ